MMIMGMQLIDMVLIVFLLSIVAGVGVDIKSYCTKVIKLNNYMKIFYRGWLAEKPINIVINLNYILQNSGKSSQKRYKTAENGKIELLGGGK